MAGLNQEPRPVTQPTSASTTAPTANAAAAIRALVRPGGVLMGFSRCSSPQPGEQAPDPQVGGLQALEQARGGQLDRSSSRIVSE